MDVGSGRIFAPRGPPLARRGRRSLYPRPSGPQGQIVGHGRPFQSRPPHRPQPKRLLRLLQRDESRDSPRSDKVDPGFHHVTTDRTPCCGRASSGQHYRMSQPVPLRAPVVRRARPCIVPRLCVVPGFCVVPGRASCPGRAPSGRVSATGSMRGRLRLARVGRFRLRIDGVPRSLPYRDLLALTSSGRRGEGGSDRSSWKRWRIWLIGYVNVRAESDIETLSVRYRAVWCLDRWS